MDFLESTPLVPWEADATTGTLTYVGPQALDYLGYPLENWLEPSFWAKHILPDDQAVVTKARDRMVQGDGSHVIEYRMERADGRVIWTCEAVSVARSGDGTAVLRGFLVDITGRKRHELALWKSEERLRNLLHGAPDAMVLTDDQGVILHMNEQAEALFEYSPAEVVGSSIDHLIPDRFQDRLVESRAAFERDPERRTLVDGHSSAILRGDGTEVPVEISMSLVRGAGDTRQILCSVRDLTARRRVEAQLRSNERRLREIADVLPAMVCLMDADQRYRFVNDAYAKWHGWEPGQVEGRLVREVIGEPLYFQLRASVEAALDGTPTHFGGTISGSEGKQLPVDMSLVPQHTEGGEVSGCLVVIFDVSSEVVARETDRRHREELAHVARVATLGELAASIAHELNQPLSAIVANAQAADHLLRRDHPDVLESREALKDISSDAMRAGEVIASMRQLLRRGETRADSVKLHDLICDVVHLLRSEAIGRGVVVTVVEPNTDLPAVSGDTIQLKQVFLNLLMNAIEAASPPSVRERTVTVVTSRKGAEAEVEIRDTGLGLPTGDPEELFAPFVSRKQDGLGMGLTISRTIVEAHGGSLAAEPNSPSGAVIRVRLPLE